MAHAAERSTYWDCLVASDLDFAGCVESGPLAAKLAGDLRHQLDEAQVKIAAGGDEGQWALYSVRFEERRFLQRLSDSFDLSRRAATSLPQPIRQLVNELAVRVAVMTGGAPNGAFEELWTAQTRAAIAAAGRNVASEQAVAALVPVPDDSAVIGQRFVEYFGHADAPISAALPISENQYDRIGQFQLAATLYLSARDTARATELHNELVAFRDSLLARGEEVSPDLETLQYDILNGVLEAGA
ncbi:MAG: hypothetical protein H7Z12_04205 [Rhodospirillaceae bacterium]|nr:hypothetical protein [Rhodospirillales bacterium]